MGSKKDILAKTDSIEFTREHQAVYFFKGSTGSWKCSITVNPFTGEISGSEYLASVSNNNKSETKIFTSVPVPLDPLLSLRSPGAGMEINYYLADGHISNTYRLSGEVGRDYDLDNHRVLIYEYRGIIKGDSFGTRLGDKWTLKLDDDTYKKIKAVGIAAVITLALIGSVEILKALGFSALVAGALVGLGKAKDAAFVAMALAVAWQGAETIGNQDKDKEIK